MQESLYQRMMYTIFWLILLSAKLAFSYYVQIEKLVKATRDLLNVRHVQFAWHELFPHDNHNIGAIIALWAPVILVYFMDTQIWYAIFSTLCGGMIGACDRLGEIRTMSMVKARFRSIPGAILANILPSKMPRKRGFSFSKKFDELKASKRTDVAKFAELWNEVIGSFRKEDLVDNREMNMLLVPSQAFSSLELIQWPPFLVAGKIPLALDCVAEFGSRDSDLWKHICGDEYLKCAVIECYELVKLVLALLVIGEKENRIIDGIKEQIACSISEDKLLANFRMSHLHALCKKFTELVAVLIKGDPSDRNCVLSYLRHIFKIVTRDMMVNQISDQLFVADDGTHTIAFPLEGTTQQLEQIKRLELLLTINESAINVPTNLEARRRMTFFTNSLFMEMPRAPRVRKMLSFSAMTPYYDEETVYCKRDLQLENEDGVSILYYLQTIFPDEWNNFMERLGFTKSSEVWSNEERIMQLRHWTSLRGQTLFRTVKGMMCYRRALMLQAFLDMADDSEILDGYNSVSKTCELEKRSQRSLFATLEAMADMKFTYVAACQNYGSQKRDGDRRATDILNLMVSNPPLRVAYIDEVEENIGGIAEKVYYSVLIKAVDNHEEEIYRIRLPGPAKLGEGKPENQNHAIIFTRGEALQAIDMNQDNYLEEAFKMRNLLEEFNEDHGVHRPTILGVREHIFTGSVSSLAWFMSNQETSFVTIGQRVLARPLKVRFHYGHPDVFDRMFHITRGGISKASRSINLSEDIFAGYNSTLRGGNVTHHEYIQVGKGRDVGFNQISLFEAKVACGNGEQILSRDVYRLGHRFDVFRMMSCYFTTVGFFVGSLMVVIIVFVSLYGKLYLSLSGMEQSVIKYARSSNDLSLQHAMASQGLVQMGLLMALPMLMEIGIEKGFRNALSICMIMLLFASVFFTFSLGTKGHFFGRTVLHGGAKYRATGRGFVVTHEKFSANYMMYSRSHFVKALEVMFLLVAYGLYGSTTSDFPSYVFYTLPIWFLVISWLFAPFIFNPSGFQWDKIVEDWGDWSKWINRRGKIGTLANRSWESWWNEEQQHLSGWFVESVLSLRFFLYQYGIVYHLHISAGNKNISVYGFSWLVIAAILLILKIEHKGKRKFSADFQLMFRISKLLLFIVVIVIFGILYSFFSLTLGDIFAGLLAFLPTGWGLLQIAQAMRPQMRRLGLWSTTTSLARKYDYWMGIIIFAPVGILAWFPCISVFQTRLLFNQAFSRGLQISQILAGRNRSNG